LFEAYVGLYPAITPVVRPLLAALERPEAVALEVAR
jgi:hypothetical protein